MNREEQAAFRRDIQNQLVKLQAEFDKMEAEFSRLQPLIRHVHEHGAADTRTALEAPAMQEEYRILSFDRLAEMMAGYLVCLQGIKKLQWMLDEYGGPEP